MRKGSGSCEGVTWDVELVVFWRRLGFGCGGRG